MTERFSVAQGKALEVRFVVGTVIEQKGWTETHQTGTTQHAGYVAGSGAVIGGGTTVNTVEIARQEVWVRHDDGQEECINFFKQTIQTRAGHRILIAVGGGVEKPAWPLAVHLFNQNKTIDFMGDSAYLFTTGMSGQGGRILFIFLCVALIFTVIGIPVALILMLVVHFRRRSLRESISRVVLPRMESLVRQDRGSS